MIPKNNNKAVTNCCCLHFAFYSDLWAKINSAWAFVIVLYDDAYELFAFFFKLILKNFPYRVPEMVKIYLMLKTRSAVATMTKRPLFLANRPQRTASVEAEAK